MKNDRCKTIAEVQESLRAAVDDLNSDNIFDRIHALLYLEASSKRLIFLFRKKYPGAIARDFDEMREAVEDAFYD